MIVPASKVDKHLPFLLIDAPCLHAFTSDDQFHVSDEILKSKSNNITKETAEFDPPYLVR